MAAVSDPAELSPAELRLLRAIANDRPLDVVARECDVSERTLRRRCRALFDKLGVGGRVEAAVWAAQHGLVAY